MRLKKKGGAMTQMVDNKNKVVILRWVDNKPVYLASNFVDAHPVEVVNRWNKKEKRESLYLVHKR